MKAFSLPVILYGLEVTELKKYAFTMLDNLINQAVHKVFKVSDNP